MDSIAIQSSAANPWFLCRIQSLAHTVAIENTERTVQMAMILGHSDRASTSGDALSTQPILTTGR
jgi:hypothetical protein